MARAARTAVLDVRAGCEHVLKHLSSLDAFSVMEGAARVLSKGETRKGELVITYASTEKGEYRVLVTRRLEGDRLVYVLKGDMNGEVRVAGFPRGGGCRVYIEAEAEGPLIDEYGGDALGRIVNRLVVSIVDRFPAVLQPRLPRGKLGDAFIELLDLLNLAVGGTARVAAGGRVRSVVLNVSSGEMVSFDGMTEEEARKIASSLAPGLSGLIRSLEEAGLGMTDRVVVSLGSRVLVASYTAGLSVVTLIEKTEE